MLRAEITQLKEEQLQLRTEKDDALKLKAEKESALAKAVADLQKLHDETDQEQSSEQEAKRRQEVSQTLQAVHAIALEDLNNKHWREVDKLKVKHDEEISRLEKKARENPAQTVRIKELEEEIRIQRSKNIESGNKLVAAKWKSLPEKSTL